ncbi:amino acid/amide ABC transporter substrate-binding protein (HAAT family) [Rhodovulum bhavnagarense]|uniref:Amino acid/amide ABC transporter substrate-binding protein (HAAT family) n=1 Tax=Rhodovulum bhavnagarense TaxID=992286 RepID=A0A4R2RCH8_9RHOB|nr:penicillin-binding protein activator [Rhodovulum bhavnagarense]TCP59829.1 amino acid/amide ABC transporter substrate-binding protein (HAAT family) [Rhodovulum bhavnagarense]
MIAVFPTTRKRLVLALAALVLLAACQTVGTGGGPGINARAPVPVALLVPGGSPAPGDAAIARSLENAARLAMADLQDVRIDLRVYATAGQPDQAALAARQAAADGAKIILGPLYAQSANAAGLAVASRGLNVLSFSNNSQIAGGNVFVLGPTFENTARRLVSYAASRGMDDLMIVHDPDVAGQVGRSAIAEAAARNGTRIVATGSYELSQNGVVQAAPGIADSVKATAPDAIFFTANTAGALPLLAQLLPDNGVRPDNTRFVGLTRWDIPPATMALPGLQGGWFALPDPGMTQQFNTRFEAAYGAPPHPTAALAYDGIAAIGALVGKGKFDTLSVRALTQEAGFAGVNGTFRLLPDGTNERALAVAQIENNQVSVIDPAPRRFSGPGF